MKKKIKIQVKKLILSHLDGYRKIDWVGYGSTNMSGQTHLNDNGAQLFPLSPTVNIYLEEDNLYRVEVELRKELIDYFHLSILQSNLAFDYKRTEPSELFYEKYTCGNFFNVDTEDENEELPLVASAEEKAKSVLYTQFKIDESEFRQYENDRTIKIRKQNKKLQKINQRKSEKKNTVGKSEDNRISEVYYTLRIQYPPEQKVTKTLPNKIYIDLAGIYNYPDSRFCYYKAESYKAEGITGNSFISKRCSHAMTKGKLMMLMFCI